MALRFAPIIRVRPEKQKKKGESLRTQETQIRQYIAMLEKAIPGGAYIPEYCWQYKGQEHATPNQERVLLDRLLNARQNFIPTNPAIRSAAMMSPPAVNSISGPGRAQMRSRLSPNSPA